MKNYNLKNILLYIPIIAFFILFFLTATNAPLYDDYNSILTATFDLKNEGNYFKKLEILYRLENYQHRLLFLKLVAYLYYSIFHTINFKALIIIGDLSLLGILFVLKKITKPIKILYFLPVVILLFSPIHFQDSITWTTCALQHAPSCFFILFAIYYLTFKTNKYRIIVASFFGLLAAYTGSNGIIFFPLLLVIIILNKNYKDVPQYLLWAIPILFGYFYDINKLTSFSPLHLNLYQKFLSSIMFIGNIFSFLPQMLIGKNQFRFQISFLFGFLFLLSFLLLFYKNFNKIFKEKDKGLIVLFANAISLFVTIFLGSFTRSFFDYDLVLSERYYVYTIILIVNIYCIYIYGITKQNELKIYFITIVCLGFSIFTYPYSINKVKNFRHDIYADLINYQSSKKILKTSFLFTDDNGIWNEAFFNGDLFKFPNKYHDQLPKHDDIADRKILSHLSEKKIEINYKNKDITIFLNEFNDHDLDQNNFNIYLLLKNKTSSLDYHFFAEKALVPLLAKVKLKYKYEKYLSFSIQKEAMEFGEYQINFVVFNNSKKRLIETSKTIKID